MSFQSTLNSSLVPTLALPNGFQYIVDNDRSDGLAGQILSSNTGGGLLWIDAGGSGGDVYTDNIFPITPSTTTTFSQNVNIGGNVNVGAVITDSGSITNTIYGINGNSGVFVTNSVASPFPAGGTALVFQTFSDASTAVDVLTLGTAAINLGVPLFPLYTYPILNTSFIGYTNQVFLSGFSILSANTLYNIAQVAIPDTGLWMITGQCGFEVDSINVLSINTVLNTVNQYCASSVGIGHAQVTNVFSLTVGTIVNLVASASAISIINNIYLVYTRIA